MSTVYVILYLKLRLFSVSEERVECLLLIFLVQISDIAESRAILRIDCGFVEHFEELDVATRFVRRGPTWRAHSNSSVQCTRTNMHKYYILITRQSMHTCRLVWAGRRACSCARRA